MIEQNAWDWPGADLRRCTKCHRDLLPRDFPRGDRNKWCKECAAEGARQWRARNPGREKDIKRKAMYGMPHGRFDEMLEEQLGGCAACGTPHEATERGLVVDHDHETGEVRALLCLHCNVALGMLKDDPERIAALLTYIWRYRDG